jgi:trigger factor
VDVQFAKTDDLNATLTITLTPEDYNPSIEKELKDLQRKVSMPGFRPGKTPMGIVKKNYGRSVLVDEVNRLASQFLFDYLRDNKIEVLGQPLLSDSTESKINFETEEDFVFAFDLGLAPDFKINIDKNDVLPFYKIKVTDEIIEEEIKNIAKRYAEVTDVDVAEEKDVIYAEVTELDEEGQPLEGGITNHKVSLTADLITNEALKNQLVGIAKDTEIKVDIFNLFNGNETVMSNALGIPKEGVNDLNKTFSMRVTEIKHYVDAELNVELFDKMFGAGVVATEEDFRKKVIEELGFYYDNEANHHLEHEITHLITDKHTFDLPDRFLKRWLMDTQSKTYTPDNIDSKYESEKAGLRYSLVRDLFEREHNLDADEEEIEKASLGYIFNLFNQYGMYNPDFTTVKAFSDEQLKKEDYRNRMREVALNRAVINKIKDLVTVEEKEIGADEFYALLNAHNHAHHEHDHAHDHDHEAHDHDHDHDHDGHEHAHSH